MSINSWRRAVAAGLIPFVIATSAAAQTPTPAAPPAYGALLTPLFAGNTTILGEAVDYPSEGVPMITNAIVTVPPGVETGWHSHSVPLFAYVLEGALTIDYGSKGVRTVTSGMSFFEAMNWPHNATNHGDTTVRLITIYLGVEGVPNAETAEGPR